MTTPSTRHVLTVIGSRGEPTLQVVDTSQVSHLDLSDFGPGFLAGGADTGESNNRHTSTPAPAFFTKYNLTGATGMGIMSAASPILAGLALSLCIGNAIFQTRTIRRELLQTTSHPDDALTAPVQKLGAQAYISALKTTALTWTLSALLGIGGNVLWHRGNLMATLRSDVAVQAAQKAWASLSR